MKLTITTKALEKLRENQQQTDKSLLLHYDTDECGCGVNGVPTIRFIRGERYGFNKVECTSISVWIDSQQAAFFEENMKLDIINGVFRLSSPAGILNPIIAPSDLWRDDVVYV